MLVFVKNSLGSLVIKHMVRGEEREGKGSKYKRVQFLYRFIPGIKLGIGKEEEEEEREERKRKGKARANFREKKGRKKRKTR